MNITGLLQQRKEELLAKKEELTRITSVLAEINQELNDIDQMERSIQRPKGETSPSIDVSDLLLQREEWEKKYLH